MYEIKRVFLVDLRLHMYNIYTYIMLEYIYIAHTYTEIYTLYINMEHVAAERINKKRYLDIYTLYNIHYNI